MQKVTTPPKSKPLRLMKSMWRQRSKSLISPEEPRLDGQLALVTGGSGGIGLETCRGLAKRGADLIISARNSSKGEEAVTRIREETSASVSFVQMDLSDLGSVASATEEIVKLWPDRKLNLLVANAGISPKVRTVLAQGHELAFATNVLGHHVLIRRLIDSSLLAQRARVIVVTGDIYILENECTPDFDYEGSSGAQSAYCRSKLGNLWQVSELTRRYTDLRVYAVHPGVVASGLGGEMNGFVRKVAETLMLSTERGTQMSLFCATQPGLVPGGYYHNTMGRVVLRDDDPAADAQKATQLWDLLEKLATKYLTDRKDINA